MNRLQGSMAGLALAAALAASPAQASPETELLTGILHETQMQGGGGAKQRLVWWIPTEFWVAAARQAPGASEPQIQEIAKLLDRYVMFAVMEGDFGPLGGMTFIAEADLRAGVSFYDGQERRVEAVAEDAIDANTANFMAMMRPMLTNLLGPMGKNMHFVLYPAADKKGKRYADPKAEGSFRIELNGEKFVFRLPLGALLPRKLCPKDGESLSGAWKYCPRHGVELQAQPKP